MSLADQLTVARALSVPIVIVLYAWSFSGHAYWATAVFCVAMTTDFFDGKLARRYGRSSALGGFAAAGAWSDRVAWWGLLVAVVLTCVSGLDYARSAPALFRRRVAA